MRLCVNLVVILLTLASVASALDPPSLDPAKQEVEDRETSALSTRNVSFIRKSKRPVAPKIHRPVAVTSLIPVKNKLSVKKNSSKAVAKVPKSSSKIVNSNKLALIHDLSEKTKAAAKARDTKKRRRTMNKAMMALLLAYKLKFATLVPTLLGGLILLVSNTALAGFFFALFAAVLGLKH